MRRNTVVAAIILAIALFPSSAVAKRNLQATVPRQDASVLELDNGVGDVTVRPSTDGDLHVTIELIPRKAGFFSSMKAAQRQVEAATLGVDRHGRRITLEIEGVSEEPRFEATWTVEVPADMDLDLDLGVGDLRVDGVTGTIDADLGVGDASLRTAAAELKVDVGVGDISLRAPSFAYADVTCSTGVGEVSLKHEGKTLRGDGMVSEKLSWKGTGSGSVSLDAGVGDIEVILTDTGRP